MASFLPWFQTGWASSDRSGDHWRTNSANAWQSSSTWAVAVVICLVAAATALAPGIPQRLRWWCPVLIAVAAGLSGWQWRSIGPLDMSGGMAWTSADPAVPQVQVGDIVRDQLVIIRIDGLTHEVGWGYFVSVAIMVVLAAGTVLLAVTRARTA